ncbi:MAG: biotin--[acetyl-CoA-carboxylase] ligase [Ignavibacteria bacterium]|nr:biotin--[acetyl-CoA-carboxylase] ligase [Ignavibacteria bacterium]
MKPTRYHFSVLTSTNEFAKELLKTEQLVVVTADFQTQGRGRKNNVWIGDFGANVYYSFGIRYDKEKSFNEVAYLQALGSLASLNVLKKEAPDIEFCLKYPNDVIAKTTKSENRKISGILVEHQFWGELCKSSVIGIGINVNQTYFDKDLEKIATSLKLLNKNIEVESVIENLTNEIMNLLSESPNLVLSEWKAKLNIIGKVVYLADRNLFLKVKGFDDVGRLVGETIDTNEIIYVSDSESLRYEI